MHIYSNSKKTDLSLSEARKLMSIKTNKNQYPFSALRSLVPEELRSIDKKRRRKAADYIYLHPRSDEHAKRRTERKQIDIQSRFEYIELYIH